MSKSVKICEKAYIQAKMLSQKMSVDESIDRSVSVSDVVEEGLRLLYDQWERREMRRKLFGSWSDMDESLVREIVKSRGRVKGREFMC